MLDLTLCLWYGVGKAVPSYDREAGQQYGKNDFPAFQSYVSDGFVVPTLYNDYPIRGGAERSNQFFR